jgi:hypothetical protein
MTNLQTQGLGDDGLFTASPSSIQTFSGRVDPLNATVDEINIEDIAHSLSRQCRYNGHCDGFMSVARHSIWVSERLESLGLSTEIQLVGLLHDAAEAYLGDLVRPLKHSEFGKIYLEVEAALEAVIAEKFGIPYPFPPEVYEADGYVLLELELPDLRYSYYGEYDEDEYDFLRRYAVLTEAS